MTTPTRGGAIARDYGALLADWDRLRTDLVAMTLQMHEQGLAFDDAGLSADAMRCMHIESGLRSAWLLMDSLRPPT